MWYCSAFLTAELCLCKLGSHVNNLQIFRWKGSQIAPLVKVWDFLIAEIFDPVSFPWAAVFSMISTNNSPECCLDLVCLKLIRKIKGIRIACHWRVLNPSSCLICPSLQWALIKNFTDLAYMNILCFWSKELAVVVLYSVIKTKGLQNHK